MEFLPSNKLKDDGRPYSERTLERYERNVELAARYKDEPCSSFCLETLWYVPDEEFNAVGAEMADVFYFNYAELFEDEMLARSIMTRLLQGRVSNPFIERFAAFEILSRHPDVPELDKIDATRLSYDQADQIVDFLYMLQNHLDEKEAEPWVVAALERCGRSDLWERLETCLYKVGQVLAKAAPPAQDKRQEATLSHGATPSATSARQGRFACEDHTRETRTSAKARLDALVGFDGVKADLSSWLARARFDAARGQKSEDMRNLIFSGAPGVGKSTLAAAFGALLAAEGFLRSKRTTFVLASELIGRYLGETERNVDLLVQEGSGGVIVIDEADRLYSDGASMSYQRSAIDALVGHVTKEQGGGRGSLFVLTGYTHGVRELLTMNPGLARRFPYRYELPSCDRTTLEAILEAKVAERKLLLSGAAKDRLMTEVEKARRVMGDHFGHVGTLETALGLAQDALALRAAPYLHAARALQRPEALPDIFKAFSQIGTEDVPRFDGKTQSFLRARPAPEAQPPQPKQERARITPFRAPS